MSEDWVKMSTDWVRVQIEFEYKWVQIPYYCLWGLMSLSTAEYDYKWICGEWVRVILSTDELFEWEFEWVKREVTKIAIEFFLFCRPIGCIPFDHEISCPRRRHKFAYLSFDFLSANEAWYGCFLAFVVTHCDTSMRVCGILTTLFWEPHYSLKTTNVRHFSKENIPQCLVLFSLHFVHYGENYPKARLRLWLIIAPLISLYRLLFIMRVNN